MNELLHIIGLIINIINPFGNNATWSAIDINSNIIKIITIAIVYSSWCVCEYFDNLIIRLLSTILISILSIMVFSFSTIFITCELDRIKRK